MLLKEKPHGSIKKLKTKPDNISRQTENKNTAFQQLYETAKAVLRGKFIATQSTPRNRKILKPRGFDCNLTERKKVHLSERLFNCKAQKKSLRSTHECFLS